MARTPCYLYDDRFIPIYDTSEVEIVKFQVTTTTTNIGIISLIRQRTSGVVVAGLSPYSSTSATIIVIMEYDL